MSLPNITFNIAKDGLGQSQADIQKIPGMVLTGATVAGAGKVTIGNSYQIFSLPEAVALGIDETGTNAFAYRHIKAFYDMAKTGAELWFMLAGAAVTMEDMADKEKLFGAKLLADAGGKVRVLGLLKKSGAAEVITNGLDADAHLAAIKAEALAADFSTRYNYVRILISGNKFSGTIADLKDYDTEAFNHVAMLIGNTDGSKEASIGLILGRLASIPSQRKLSRVKDGPVDNLQAYFTNGNPVESLATGWNAIHDKHYIFLRSFSGRSGYYFTSDCTLTATSDDFNSLARGLVMDEAVLLAYNTLVEELSDEVPVTQEGTIHPAIIKTWQQNVDGEIRNLMVAEGKLSDVKVFIDANQNILTTGNFNVGLQLLPVGYSDYIIVNIGFTTNIE
ncbi:DUF2586 family protein [Flavobacterium sp. DG1-102-2]|uniref:DUF2586 family protein n=1 Tax=Flavobacterium sp. DG1-102-2 TaxID=3081663 RepID=UPI00294953E8|nr:DUF2586 family protein [Flavobacterium sp. DG1-102-2]MDV6170232.1 DUF2586 family protein [Flavobacterium sp. DG1-102-2]